MSFLKSASTWVLAIGFPLLAQAATATGTPLRSYADQMGFYIGTEVGNELSLATQPNPTNSSLIGSQYNIVVAGNAMKWLDTEGATAPKFDSSGNIIQNNSDFNFTPADALFTFAQANKVVVRAHTLLYYREEPTWLTGCASTSDNASTCTSPYNSNQLQQIMEYHIRNVMTHFMTKFPGMIVAWDVTNEVAYNAASYRHSVFEKIVDPATGQPSLTYYIKLAFQYAHSIDPSVGLCYNENTNEDLDNANGHGAYNLVKTLLQQGAPITCFGLQMHKSLPAYKGTASMPTRATLRDTMRRYADIGIKVFITEMDVGIPLVPQTANVSSLPVPAPTTTNPAYWSAQASVYSDAIGACLDSINCLGVLTWGWNPTYSWLSATNNNGISMYGLPEGYSADGLPFDAGNQPKPAYFSMQTQLADSLAASQIFYARNNPIANVSMVVTSPTSQYYNDLLIYTNGTLNNTVQTSSSGLYDLHLRAAGVPAASGWPAVKVIVDGVLVTTLNIASAYHEDYSVQTYLSKGTHTIALNYFNDYSDPVTKEDRNVYIDRLVVKPSSDFSKYMMGNEFNTPTSGSYVMDPLTANTSHLTMSSNMTATASFNVPVATSYEFLLGAFGTLASGVGPQITVQVDGLQVGGYSVSQTGSPMEFPMIANLAAGAHTLSVAFTNAISGRTLVIDHLQVLHHATDFFSLTPLSMAASVPASVTLSNEQIGSSPVYLSRSYTVPTTGYYSLTVVAASQSTTNASGVASFALGQLLIDGVVAGSFQASSDAWTSYPFNVLMTAGTHTLAVNYTNDSSVAPGGFLSDRSLTVQGIRIATGTGVLLPDLVITSMSMSPAVPTTGQAVTFQVTVKNQGNAATPAGVEIGVGFKIDGTEVTWSANDTTSLAPGASVVLTSSGGPTNSATWAATAGSHTLLATVNDANRFPEGSTSNNSASQTFTVITLLPDVVITSLAMNPATPIPGQTVTFSAVVKNQGAAATPTGAEIGVGFSIDGSEVTWSGNDFTSLAAGASVTLTASGGPTNSATWTATAGSHTLLGNVNSPVRFPESNTTNNTLSKSFTATTPLPDLIITAMSMSPAAPTAGQAVTFQVTVKNQGTAATPAGVEVGVGFRIDGSEVTWSGNDVTSLAAGASVVLKATGGPTNVATWKATSGTHTLVGTANDANRFPESSTTNNSMTQTFTVK